MAKLRIHSKEEYVTIEGKRVLCDGKICGQGKYAGGGHFLCSHYNLKVKFPKIAEEWDYGKNQKGPEEYTPKSNMVVFWNCKNNPCGCHNWKTAISHRTKKIRPTDCPFCKSGKPCIHNNLAVKFPELAFEFDKERNIGVPGDYACNSNKVVWWICKKTSCNCHRWESRISHRTGISSGCPFCNHGKICSHNNLAIKFPELVKEWDCEKNHKTPDEYSYGSKEKVWWICQENKKHNWQSMIVNRTRGKGCPFCFYSRIGMGYSKASIEWLKSIELDESVKIQYIDPKKGIAEFIIPEVGKVDGYCHETNTVYEFHGDFWHGNPNVFDPEDINPVNGKTFEELYNTTIERDNKIRKLGFNLVVKWESD